MDHIAISRGLPPPSVPSSGAPGADRDAALRESARAFESVFVAQMLAYSGLSKAVSADGGFGGEAFASLLVEQYAAQLVERGGFGLAEKIYEQLRDKEGLDVDRTIV